MYRFSLLFTLVAVISDSTGFYFGSASLGGQIQGDQQWQEFDNNFEDKFTYQAPTHHQQFVDYQHQSYQHNPESLRPTQTLVQAAQHLLPPAQQFLQPAQHLIQPAQQLFHSGAYAEPEQIYQPLPPSYLPSQILNRFQHSPLAPQNGIPVVIRLVENQSLLPFRAVYSLPPFLEKLVQRVQGYYSIYNNPETLTLDRPFFRPTESPATTDSTAQSENITPDTVESVSSVSTTSSEQSVPSSSSVPTSNDEEQNQEKTTQATEMQSSESTPQMSNENTSSNETSKVPTLNVIEVTPTTAANDSEQTTTEAQMEQTTDPSNDIPTDTASPDQM